LLFAITALCGASWLACTGTDNPDDDANPDDASDAPLVLSASKVAAGQFITISHPTIRAGEGAQIRFRQFDGPEWIVELPEAEEGAVRIQVPPLIWLAGDGFRGGFLRVSLVGIDDEQSLEVETLPDFSALPPGTILDMLLQSAIVDLYDTETTLRTGQDEYGVLAGTAASIDAINEERRRLEELHFQLVLNESLRVSVSEDVEITLTERELRRLDVYLAVMLAGLRDELQLAGGGATARVLDESCWEQIRNGTLKGADEIVDCVTGIVDDVKRDALEGAKKAGAFVGTTISFAFTAGGALVQEGRLFLTGVLTTAGNSIWSFGTAYFSKENTDAFLLRQGERFNASKEALSQVFRNATNFLGGLPGRVGVFFTAVTAATSVKDLNSIAASERCPREPAQRILQAADDATFCQLVLAADTPDGDPGDVCGGCADGLICDEATGLCAGCLDDADCTDGMVCSPDLKFCVECVDDADCVASGRGTRCFIISCADEAAQCATDADCRAAGLGNTCSAETHTCLDVAGRCFSNSDCGSAQPFCVFLVEDPTAAGSCSECRGDSDCDDGLYCNGAESCNAFGQCRAGPLPCLTEDMCDEAANACVETCVPGFCPADS